MLPKLAFFAATIKELTAELKPALEKTLGEARHPVVTHLGERRR